MVDEHLAQDEINDNSIDRERKQKERLGIQMVLDFYVDPDTETDIQYRMDFVIA